MCWIIWIFNFSYKISFSCWVLEKLDLITSIIFMFSTKTPVIYIRKPGSIHFKNIFSRISIANNTSATPTHGLNFVCFDQLIIGNCSLFNYQRSVLSRFSNSHFFSVICIIFSLNNSVTSFSNFIIQNSFMRLYQYNRYSK